MLYLLALHPKEQADLRKEIIFARVERDDCAMALIFHTTK
jgi:hypothetical protein